MNQVPGDAKKFRTIGILLLVVAIICFCGFAVSAIVNQPVKAERFLNKYEKLCKESNTKKIARLYAKDANVSPEDVVIPFEGYNPDFIYEGVRDLGDKNYELSYTVYYEVEEEKTVDGETKKVKVPFSFSGNKLALKKTILGYRIYK